MLQVMFHFNIEESIKFICIAFVTEEFMEEVFSAQDCRARRIEGIMSVLI